MSMRGMLLAGLLAGFVATPVAVHADDATPTLKVMSFNIRFGSANDGENHWDKRKEFVAEVVKETAPDLLGTQETLKFQRDYLSEHVPGYEQLSTGRDDGTDRGEMTPVFWKKDRFEKLEGGHFWLSPTPNEKGSKGWDAALPRIASWVKLKDRQAPTNAQTILFINTHFDHMGKVARAESAKLIRSQIAQLGTGCSVIVTGDFNAGEATLPYQALFDKEGDAESTVVDTYRLKHPQRAEAECTFNGWKTNPDDKGARIDWIAVSRDFKVTEATINRVQRDGRFPSDHYPITATLSR